jgi:hypothetical protein
VSSIGRSISGGTMFGIVPRVVSERRLPPDAQHRVALAWRCVAHVDRRRKRRPE